MARIIGEVRPRYAFVENSPMLVGRGLARVLGDLTEMGYGARWCCLAAADVGAPHERERIWILGHADHDGQASAEIARGTFTRGDDCAPRAEQTSELARSSIKRAPLADANSQRQLQPERVEQDQRRRVGNVCSEVPDAHKEEPARLRSGAPAEHSEHRSSSECLGGNQGWPPEPGVGRSFDGMAQ